MMHDPLVDKFREHRAWRQKVKKAKARKLKEKHAKLLQNEPKYTLTHLIKERYPTFMDAIRDLDDAVTMIHLFMIMPTRTIKPSTSTSFMPLFSLSSLHSGSSPLSLPSSSIIEDVICKDCTQKVFLGTANAKNHTDGH